MGNLEKALAEINKRFGKDSVIVLGDKNPNKVNCIPTGSMQLDKILGGGIAIGRVAEIYGVEGAGKTSLCLQVVAQCQKMGGNVAYVDVENAVDLNYAKTLGVDVKSLIFSQPSSAEQALDIVEALVKSNEVKLVVIDSVAALAPQAELDGEMGDATIGLQARLMGKALRKITAALNQSNCAAVFINQLRSNIGSYGCLNGSTLVTFEDGTKRYISDVVKNKISGRVWSYNEKENKFELANIIDWHINGKVNSADDFIHIVADNIEPAKHGNHQTGITVTPNHLVMTESGWKEAKNVSLNDKLMTKYTSIINGTLADFLWGTFIGDSSIQKRTDTSANLGIRDNQNRDYMEWKVSKINQYIPMKKKLTVRKNEYCYTGVNQSFELALIKEELGNRDPEVMLRNHYSDLGLAIWFMDDGGFYKDRKVSISIKRFKNDIDKIHSIQNAFEEATGIPVRHTDAPIIAINKEYQSTFFNKICKYVPKCMEYKLPDEYKNRYVDFELSSYEEVKSFYVKIREISKATPHMMRDTNKYDLTIEGNHNYMVGSKYAGVIVHNSPDTTPGGRALKYAASQRIEMRKTTAIKEGPDVVGNMVKIKIVKNKISPPQQVVELPLIFGKGFSPEDEVFTLAVEFDIIHKSGAWMTTHDDQRFQGMANTKGYYLENPELLEELTRLVKDKLAGVEPEPEYEIDPNTGEVIM